MSALFSENNVQFVLRSLMRLGAPARDVEDLAQEVFVIAHRRRGDFDPSRHVAPWLYGITRNVLRDYRKLARNRYEVPSDALVDGARREDGAAAASAGEDTDLLRRSLATLPEELADVIVLCDLSGLTVLETAEALGVPEGTLKDRLRRARRDLRAEVDRRREEVARA